MRKNPGYSLRAFARDLEMQPSKISEILRGRCGLSPKSARKVAKRLKLSSDETEHFAALVALNHGRSERARKQAEERLASLSAVQGYDSLTLDRFKIISDWYHFAILELTELSYFESTPSWIAGRLGIATELTNEAIDRLIKLGLLKKNEDGKFVQTNLHLATPSGIPSRELREYHSQLLKKADDALDQIDISERDFSSVILTINSKDMESARREFKEFRRKFCVDFQKEGNKDRVYCLGMQFYPLDRASAVVSEGHQK
jgi:uncharacterized protein (TIGR02147 family)